MKKTPVPTQTQAAVLHGAHRGKRKRAVVILTFLFAPMLLLFVFTYLPFFDMIRFSFYDRNYLNPGTFVGLKNYIDVFQRDDCFKTLIVSVYYMGGAVVQLALALYFASLIPGIATQVTVYQIMYNLHLINHLYGYIIVLCGTDIISIYIFLQFFENLPRDLDESGIIDGCGYFGIFFRILFPLLKPAIVASCVLKGVSIYNEYYMSNLYLTDSGLKTISTALYTFTGPYGSQYNYICAGVLITIIPILILFLVCQKQVYGGMAAGAVKG